MLFGLCLGGWTGYAIDAYRDLSGLQHCERPLYPLLLKRLSPRMKKGLAVALTAASVGLTGLVYSFTPDAPPASGKKTSFVLEHHFDEHLEQRLGISSF